MKINGILIIDDDTVSNTIFEGIIKKINLTDNLLIASNGLEALQKITTFTPKGNLCPELIFLNLELPVIDGTEFLKSYKELTFDNKENVRIIAFSPIIKSNYYNVLRQLNIRQFLIKPFNE